MLLLLVFAMSASRGQSYRIQSFAGDGAPFDENALTAHLTTPSRPAIDRRGTLYFSLSQVSIVVRVDSGRVTRIAGNGKQGFGGDGGPALDAQLAGPGSVAVNAAGDVFISDSLNCRIRKVDAVNGFITTVAGTGRCALSRLAEITGTATSLALGGDNSLAVDPAGNLHIFAFCQIIKVYKATGLISRVAGTGECNSLVDDVPAIDAPLSSNLTLRFDGSGNIYLAGQPILRKIEATTGILRKVAGGGATTDIGDGGPALSAVLSHPTDVAVNAVGDVFIADRYRVRKVDGARGTITTLAGTGASGESGDGGPSAAATVGSNLGIALDAGGNLFITDWDYERVRRVDSSTGIISTYAGDGIGHFSGDGGPVAYSQVRPLGVAVDGQGNLYLADESHRVRRVDALTHIITTVAGTGKDGFSGDGGPAVSAAISPVAVALDSSGNLYIADGGNARVRKVDTTGVITTFAGGGSANSNRGPATSLELGHASGVAVDSSGNVFVSDNAGKRVYKVDKSSGLMTLVAGAFGHQTGGDGGPATSTNLKNPNAIAVDTAGNLFIADPDDGSVRRRDASTGIITTFAGSPDRNSAGSEGVSANTVYLSNPSAISFDPLGNLLITEKNRSVVRRVDAQSKIISTIAGNPACCDPGADGAIATKAHLNSPVGVAAAPDGKIYVSEAVRVRVLTPIPPDEAVITGVGNGASFSGAISPGAWISITGANLSRSTRGWNASDFQGNRLPLSLDDVGVLVDGKPAAISYISPTQINAQCPDVAGQGNPATARVQLVLSGRLSAEFSAPIFSSAPALFGLGQYVAAVHADGSLVGLKGDFGSPSTHPAAAGEIISVFGTGFGASNPAIPAGVVPTSPQPLVTPAGLWMGNEALEVVWAGIVGPGLDQLNVVIPTSITGSGRYILSIIHPHAASQSLFLAVSPK